MPNSWRAVLGSVSLALLGVTACTGSAQDATTAPGVSATASVDDDDGPGGGTSCSGTGATASAPPAGTVPALDVAAVDTAVADVAAKAQALVDLLTDEQRQALVRDFDAVDTKRCSWSNFPDGLFDGRLGVSMGDLDDAQRAAAFAVVESALSADGYAQVRNTILGDDQLAAEGGGMGEFGEDSYHLVLFGQPSTASPWTLQFGGHHLAVHISAGAGVVSVSPQFAGAQPVSFTSAGQTIRPMGQETDDVFGLFASLDADAQAGALLEGAYEDIVMGPGVDTDYPEQEGLGYGELTTEQQDLVRRVIEDYAGDGAEQLSQPLLDLYLSQLDQTTIAYTGETDPDSAPAYFRIDGPRVWIEWLSTDAPAFHFHTVFRDKALDYGTGTVE